MNTTISNAWHRIWSKRVHRESEPENILEYLIELDGFDTSFGAMKANDWSEYVRSVSDLIKIRPGESLFEVGCGSGAFLYPFYSAGHPVGGLDYSYPLIAAARKYMPLNADNILHQSAIDLNPPIQYDHIVSNHVFHYFSDKEYCKNVLAVMLLHARINVLITALPDTLSMNESERFRRAQMSPDEYNKKYKDLHILYFSKEDLEDQARSHGYISTFIPHKMPGFAQSHPRFDCLFTRK